MSTPNDQARRLHVFNFTDDAELLNYTARLNRIHPSGGQQLRPDFLMEVWDAAFLRRARFVWSLEMDVALAGGDWKRQFERIDEKLSQMDYIFSSAMPVQEGLKAGNMRSFFERPRWRRAEHWVARYSPSFLRAIQEYVQRGIYGSPQQVLPSLCYAIGCNAYSLASDGQLVFLPNWDWAPTCKGLATAFELVTRTRAGPGIERDAGQFVHPFKWDMLAEPRRYAEYAAKLRRGDPSIGFLPWIRKRKWRKDLPRRHADERWQLLDASVRDRCRPPLGEEYEWQWGDP